MVRYTIAGALSAGFFLLGLWKFLTSESIGVRHRLGPEFLGSIELSVLVVKRVVALVLVICVFLFFLLLLLLHLFLIFLPFFVDCLDNSLLLLQTFLVFDRLQTKVAAARWYSSFFLCRSKSRRQAPATQIAQCSRGIKGPSRWALEHWLDATR